MACADDERILLVHHTQPPPRVCERDIEGVSYAEQDDDLPVDMGPTHVA